MGLAAKVWLIVSIVAAILVVSIGGTFLGYGNALQTDGMPTMARVVKWNHEVRYRYTVDDKEYENADAVPKGFAGVDGNYVRVTYLPYRPDVAHIAPKELAARGGMILIFGLPLSALLILSSTAAVLRIKKKGQLQ